MSIFVLGPMRAAINARDVRLRKRKARALLAYLALTDGQQETRERLAGLLWNDSDEGKARSSLRQVLHELAEDLSAAGYTRLQRDRLRVILDPAGLETDSQTILEMARDGVIHPRLVDETLISESFLRDMDDIDPAFSQWAKSKRQSFHEQLLQRLQNILAAPGTSRETSRQCAQAIMNLDPANEEACRHLMRSFAESGDTAGALRIYKTLWDLLDSEYDTDPAPETVALIAEIKQGTLNAVKSLDSWPPAADLSELFPQPPQSTEPADTGIEADARLAVLVEPFGVNGVDPEMLHLVDSFRHDLVASLVRYREWFVVSGNGLSSGEIDSGRISGAYCVAATNYRAGDAMSVVLTLREYDTGIHVWSERYVLSLQSGIDSQQTIVRQISVSLGMQISLARLKRRASEPVGSLAVYDLWLRGQAALNRLTAAEWQPAARMFTAAVQRAPNFAPAYSGLAQMHNASPFVHSGLRRSAEQARQTLELARRAVALDPMDSRSQLALGWSLAMKKSYRQAVSCMELAWRLNPVDAWTLISSALCMAFCGSPDQAGDLAAQALGLTPAPSRLHWTYQAQLAFVRGDYAFSLEAAERSDDFVPTMAAWRAAALAHLGRPTEAREVGLHYLNMCRNAWFGEEPPTDAAIGKWILGLYPFANAADWERLRDGFVAAGISDGGSRHQG